jgi:hypothetical protein
MFIHACLIVKKFFNLTELSYIHDTGCILKSAISRTQVTLLGHANVNHYGLATII